MKKYCTCEKPERGLYQDTCKICSNPVLSEYKCVFGSGMNRFLFKDECPICSDLKVASISECMATIKSLFKSK